jgi:Mrp family chromosome partitioning ATPase
MPDSLVFTSYVDAILLVVERGRTSKQDILETLDQMKDAHILGLVFNDKSA